ncbi:MAG: M1 family aminopeptidase [Candidatus Krumholzibacteriota bacterium]
MSIRPIVSARRPHILLLIAALALMTFTAPGAPAAPVDDPAATRAEILEHRFQEAASKNLLVKGLLAAEAGKTLNQDLYDVHHYDLDLDLDPGTTTLTGTVIVTAEVTGPSITTMDLNLTLHMTVTGVTAGGIGTGFSRIASVLTVDLDRAYTTGETVVVTVDYNGNPAGGSFGWDSYGGQDMIWTLSEPFGARDWWPCKDLNSDKADSVDVTVTVPDHLVVASNGLVVSDVDNGSTRTTHWKSNYPIATYLVSLAIHPYVQYSDWYNPLGGGGPMEVQFYIYPSHVGLVEPNYALTVPMIDVFAQAYGEYPFVNEKYGHAEFTWGGGMEHQTLTSMGGWSEDLISHELAHQWWGDMVTCEDFGHIWLNEGFATWSEAYWAEQNYDIATYRQYMDFAAYYGAGTIFVEDPLTENIFDGNLSYNKGSWVVHMLRGVLGDSDFFAGLALYRANHGFGSATTEELQAAMETVSGQDLTAFFQQWIYGEYFPVYSYSWVTGPGVDEITVTIVQEQTDTGLFTMPIDLRITTTTGTTDVTVANSLASEDYVLTVTGTPESVLLDPDRWILRQVRTEVTDPTFDKGILLVNGVHWGTYGVEITSAYADSVFWGDNPITFWDCFPEPAGGYPANLPAPIGHDAVPASVIGEYSTVIWVGNNYNGDLAKWAETPIQSYLEVGGNLLLLTRRSKSFLEGDLTTYLGVTWAEETVTLGNYLSVVGGLAHVPFIGSQSWNDVYLASTGPESSLLFVSTEGFSGERGVGVWASPTGGGTFRATGGQFVHLAGRPYRMDHILLRQNVEYILENYLDEPYNPASPVPGDGTLPGATAVLGQNYPNPFNPSTTISFNLAAPGPVLLRVFDVSGRLVRTLVDDGDLAAGNHQAVWSGQDQSGRAAAAGVYFYKLDAAEYSRTRRMTMVK